jgi:hypothetical protein
MLDIEYDLAAHVNIPPDPLRESSITLYWHSLLSRDLKEQRDKDKTNKQQRPRILRR